MLGQKKLTLPFLCIDLFFTAPGEKHNFIGDHLFEGAQIFAVKPDQCLKHRVPVKTIEMPNSLQASITSWSRLDPPG